MKYLGFAMLAVLLSVVFALPMLLCGWRDGVKIVVATVVVMAWVVAAAFLATGGY